MGPHIVNKEYLIGYLKGALIDGCIKLPDDWENRDEVYLGAKAKEAENCAAEKILRGEVLPTEMMSAKEIADFNA